MRKNTKLSFLCMDKIKCIITLGFGETLLYKNSKKSKLMLNI